MSSHFQKNGFDSYKTCTFDTQLGHSSKNWDQEARGISSGNLLMISTHNKSYDWFQACIAFVFVTIPSLSSSLHQRLLLYQLTSQVAFQCRCIGQAEACIVALLRDLGAASGNDEGLILSDFLPSFISYTCTLSFDKESEFTQSTLVKATLKVSVPLAKQSSGNQQLSLIKLYIKAMTSLVSSSHSEDFQMCMDLITLVQARLDFLFAQDHLRSVGCMGAVKLYHWLKNHTKEAALLNEIRDIIEANAFDMDKETTTLWRRLSIE